MTYGRIRRGPMAADAFTQIRNAVFRDVRLSAKAMGIFGHISTHRDGWGITPESMSTQMRDGVDSIKAGLRELERYSYLQRTRERRPDGTLGASVYFITDQPEAIAALLGEENPRSLPGVDFPPLAEPSQAEPYVVEPPLAEPAVVDPPHKNTNSKNPKGKKTLSPRAAASKAIPKPPATPKDEREKSATPANDTAAVAAAWTAARGDRRNPAAERDIAASAHHLLAAAWPLPDVIALAEDMARRQPTYRDLTRHADHWQPPRPAAAAGPGLPTWCGHCADEDPAARFNVRLRRRAGALCADCHPDAAAAA